MIDEKKSIDQACKDFGLCPSHVNSQECSLPLGFLAYGNEERKEEYLKEDSLKTNLINRPMMLIAGFTNQRLKEFLSYLKEKEIPYIAFKAVLTEYNAEWDSIELFSELEKDEAYFKNTKKTEE
ncbi:MAG: DUF3783 domain-containing protein [Eubacteriales bacterium]|nr:DUF3783 domain-containing protein [Eubacteriales bacterium]